MAVQGVLILFAVVLVGAELAGRHDHQILQLAVALTVVSFACGVALLIAASGVLSGRPWFRWLAIGGETMVVGLGVINVMAGLPPGVISSAIRMAVIAALCHPAVLDWYRAWPTEPTRSRW